jgi:hypothetical protein
MVTGSNPAFGRTFLLFVFVQFIKICQLSLNIVLTRKMKNGITYKL